MSKSEHGELVRPRMVRDGSKNHKKINKDDGKKIFSKKKFFIHFWVIFDFGLYLKSAILEGMAYLSFYKG